MVTARNEGFDHMTIVVTDLQEARRFFGLLGFEETHCGGGLRRADLGRTWGSPAGSPTT